MVGATTKGKIFVWKKVDKSIILAEKSTRQYEIWYVQIDFYSNFLGFQNCDSNSSSVAWHPKLPELAFIDVSGHWCVISNISQVSSRAVNEVAKKMVTKKLDEEDSEANDMLDDEQVTFLQINQLISKWLEELQRLYLNL